MDKDEICFVKSNPNENITITLPYRGPGHECILRSDLDVVSVEMPTPEELARHNEAVNNYLKKHYPTLEKIEAKVVFGKVIKPTQS